MWVTDVTLNAPGCVQCPPVASVWDTLWLYGRPAGAPEISGHVGGLGRTPLLPRGTENNRFSLVF